MATIEDVARAAGVSISTVSYALSGKRAISEDTRRRVLAAAARLGYAPKAAARALAARRTRVIAVTTPLHPDTDQSAHMAFAMAVTRAARDHDYDTLLLVQDDELEGMRRSAATSLADGIIVLDVSAHDARADLARTLDCPVVFIGLPRDTDGLTCVDLDFRAAATQAVDELYAHGHRSVALVSQPAAVIARESNYPLRIEGAFTDRAAELGMAHAVVRPRPTDPSDIVTEALRLVPGLTGLVVSTSADIAAALPAVLAARALRVPQDVSVIAVGMTPDPGRAPLPFDTLPLDPSLTCPVAVDVLVSMIEGSAAAGEVRLVPPVRQSRGSVAVASLPSPNRTA